jgi:phosphoribosyl-dephospho-CoA transferase
VISKLLSEHKTPILSITIVASGSAQKIKSMIKLPIE